MKLPVTLKLTAFLSLQADVLFQMQLSGLQKFVHRFSQDVATSESYHHFYLLT